MFRDEKIVVIDGSKDRSLKLEKDGRIICLIFIKGDKLIIKGELEVGDSSISCPDIKII